MTINELKKLLVEFDENLEFEQSLKKKNWFNIGGKSKIFRSSTIGPVVTRFEAGDSGFSTILEMVPSGLRTITPKRSGTSLVVARIERVYETARAKSSAP